VSELSSLDQHPADLGSETFERERDLSLLEEVEVEIADIRRAFVRLDRGVYGSCEACGCDIGDDRLEAMPAARSALSTKPPARSRPAWHGEPRGSGPWPLLDVLPSPA
jgi:RNA polymerase-binding transcription factor DksA